MPKSIILNALILLLISVPIVQSQSPIQGITPYVQAGKKSMIIPTSVGGGSYTVAVTLSRLFIPSPNHRKPFVTLSYTSRFESQNNKKFHMFADMNIVTNTSFNIRLDLVNTINGPRSWLLTSTVKFDYILLSGALPESYISNKLDVLKSNTASFPVAGGVTKSFALSTWLNSAPLNLLIPTIKFVFGILYTDIQSMNNDNKFSLNLKFFPNTTSTFYSVLTSPNSLKIRQLKVSLFIYDKAIFDANKISLLAGYWVVPAFGTGLQFQYTTQNGWYNFPGMQTLCGLAGFEFTTNAYFGINVYVELLAPTVDLRVAVQNLFMNAIPIPKLQITYLTASQLACPNNEPLLSQALTTCYTTCPSGFSPSTTPLGLTGLYVCTPCSTCCPTGTYFNGAGCSYCTLNCVMCSTATNCVVCSNGFVKDASGNCVAVVPCYAPCTSCDPLGCTACSQPFELGAGACICPAGTTQVSSSACDPCTNTLSNCSFCNSPTVCTQCDPSFYVTSSNTCAPCSTGCITCDSLGCTQCLSFLTLTTGICTCTPGTYYDAATQSCPTCTLANCLECSSSTTCTLCAAKYFINPSGGCSPCGTGCLVCSSGGCSSCETFMTLVSGTCMCPAGSYYDTATNACLACNGALTNCVECSSSTVCTLCSTGYYIKTGTTTCSVCGTNCLTCDNTGCLTCQSGFATTTDPTATPPIICKACNLLYHSSCTACDSTVCTTCTSPFVVGSGTCVCSTGTTLSGSTCIACSSVISNCLQCSSKTVCTKCSNGFYINSFTQCSLCNPGCVTCSSLTLCTQCMPNLILSSTSSCVCPAGFYFDGMSACLTCSSVLPGCSQCSSSTVCTLCGSTYYLPSGATSCVACSPNCQSCDASGCLTCQNGFTSFLDPSTFLTICQDCKVMYGSGCLSCDLTQCTTCSANYFWLASTKLCTLITSVVCGDGIWIDQMEACDDGNAIDGDGCSAQCQVETDYACLVADKLPSGASLCRFTKELSVVFDHLEKEVSSNVVHLFLNLQPLTFSQWTQQTIQNLLNPIEIVDQITGQITVIPFNSLSMKFTRNSQANQIQLTIDYGQNNLENTYLRFNIDPTATNLQSLKYLSVQNSLFLQIDSEKSGVYLYGYGQDVYATQAMVSSISTGIGYLALLMGIIGFCIPAGKLIIIEALAVVQISYFSVLQFHKIPPTFTGFKNLILSNGYNDPTLFSSSQTQIQQNIYNLMGLKIGALSNINISLVVLVFLPALIGGIGLLITKFIAKPDLTTMSNENEPLKTNETTVKEINQQKEQQIIQETECKDSLNHSKVQSIIDKLNTSRLNEPQNLQAPKNAAHCPNRIQESKNNQLTQNTVSSQQKPSLSKIVFERIFYETTFYGIFLTSYLAWVSIFHSFSNLQITSIIIMVLDIVFVLAFSILFARSTPNRFSLKQLFGRQEAAQPSQISSLNRQKLTVSTKFGQFSESCIQKMPNPTDPVLKIYSKLSLVFLIERLLSSICIIFIASSMVFVSAFIAVIYTVLLIVLIIINKKLKAVQVQQKKAQRMQEEQGNTDKVLIQPCDLPNQTQSSNLTKKSSRLAFFYQNYLFRQGFNFSIVILIQIIYLYANMTMASQDPYQTFVNNSFITKIVPILVLVLLLLSMLFNIFLWIVDMKFDLFIKIKEIKSLYSSQKCKQSNQEQKSAKQPIYKSEVVSVKKTKKELYQTCTKKQEEQVVNMLNKFMEQSAMFRTKESPFLGIQEKQASKQALIGLFKIEEEQRVDMSAAGKQLRNKLITQVWDQI